ncbi:LuxR C-terminal-related transcriptional regulator [Variovorax sp. KK3]|uniref:LuxR C-terminal-related transcriptional regulator n=1 Tax=Variovorax sp. KK3 TaxID=1855728 RepID=UPI00097BEA3D|nr:LuxR C-terminal-related transcriptional regulator [Variovorax sp. KK3]
MQSIHLARAEIKAPHFRSGLIPRNRLERQLGDALARYRAVLLVAPAGYGKTAALSRQLEDVSAGRAVAWLTVDEEDDLQRLLSYLIQALDPFDPPWRVAPEILLDLVTQGKLREAADALLQTLEATDVPNGGVLVLDDVHCVTDLHVFEFLRLLLEGLPAGWTLAIATREEPPPTLGLARWRARRELAEFDTSSLSFSMDEVQALMRHANGSDDPERAKRLFERTQGWAAGLCLGLEASEQSSASAPRRVWQSRRHLFDYLASEIFQALPVELQQFLLRCSVLSELTAERCALVTGQSNVEGLLDELERRRLFVSVLDEEELTLRLHDLFRDFLEERLRRLNPHEVPGLLRRAAAGEHDLVRRTLAYLRAGAWDEAQQSLSSAAPDMLASDEYQRVIHMIEQFPADVQARSPSLAYIRGLHDWRHDQYAAVHVTMTRAAQGFEALDLHDDAQRARAMQALAMYFCGQMDEARQLGQAVRARAMSIETEALCELLDFWYECHRGPVEGPGLRLARLVDLLNRSDSAELWSRCMPRVNLFIGRPGVSRQIQRLVRGARAAAGETHWSLQANINMTEAWLLLWQGRIAELELAFDRIEADAHWLGQPPSLRVRLLLLKIMVHVAHDDRAAVRATGDAIAALAATLDRASELPSMSLALTVRAYAAVEDWDAVRADLPKLEAAVGYETGPIRMQIDTIKAMLALHEGRVADALKMLRPQVAGTQLHDTAYIAVMARTRLALAELASGAPDSAWSALQPLIERVMASNDTGPILTSGTPTLAALSRTAWSTAVPERQLATLRDWSETLRQFKAKAETVPGPGSPPAAPAGLTARELEVLALLAGGQSNKVIARLLDLSPHTVKRHVARILDRLDLSSRVEAAGWYRARTAG